MTSIGARYRGIDRDPGGDIEGISLRLHAGPLA
jgi:hypothetical protein